MIQLAPWIVGVDYIKYLFEVLPCLFWHFGLSNVAEHVIMNTWCKAVQHVTRCFDITLPSWMVGVSWVGLRFFATCCFNITLPSWMVSVCWVGLRFLCFFDITLIALTDKVLVHLVFPICEVVSIQLFTGKRIVYVSIHDCLNGFSCSSSLSRIRTM